MGVTYSGSVISLKGLEGAPFASNSSGVKRDLLGVGLPFSSKMGTPFASNTSPFSVLDQFGGSVPMAPKGLGALPKREVKFLYTFMSAVCLHFMVEKRMILFNEFFCENITFTKFLSNNFYTVDLELTYWTVVVSIFFGYRFQNIFKEMN